MAAAGATTGERIKDRLDADGDGKVAGFSALDENSDGRTTKKEAEDIDRDGKAEKDLLGPYSGGRSSAEILLRPTPITTESLRSRSSNTRSIRRPALQPRTLASTIARRCRRRPWPQHHGHSGSGGGSGGGGGHGGGHMSTAAAAARYCRFTVCATPTAYVGGSACGTRMRTVRARARLRLCGRCIARCSGCTTG